MHRPFGRVVALMLGVLFATANISTALASHISYDPYADSVQASSSTGVTNPNAALGPPDGVTTSTFGVQKFITLDMGEGEEGTGTLRIYFGAILLRSQMSIEFLDDHLSVIKTATSQPSASSEAHTEDFAYDYSEFDQAYRYVRLTNLAEAGNSLDAIQALAYIGSSDTVDTDGDCVPDRDEQHDSTDPQVVDNTCPPASPDDSCTEDEWVCGEWSSCSAGGLQTRNCSISSDCPGVSTSSPTTSQTCSASASCDRDVWTCGEWSVCSADGRETRSCSMTFDCSSASTASPATARSCTPLPYQGPPPTTTPPPSTPTSETGEATPDITPPVISDVRANALSTTVELIQWNTDEPADSLVEYGKEGESTQLSPFDENLVTGHAVTLTDLEPGTTYTYRVYSRDAAGNASVSAEYTFTTEVDFLAETSSWFQGWSLCHWLNLLLLVLLIASVIGNIVQSRRTGHADKQEEPVAKKSARRSRR